MSARRTNIPRGGAEKRDGAARRGGSPRDAGARRDDSSPRAGASARAGSRDSERFAIDAAKLAAELKCTGLSVRDVRGLSPVCDFMVIASGTSERQMRAVAQRIEDLGKERGSPPFRLSRDGGESWIVIDFVDVVVHLFEPSQRVFYDLDELWSDAPAIAWRGAAR